jgi:predicted nucleotidyltransferase
MEERINKILDDIEKEHKVKILYACESGSRAWGFDSVDSDFDVRFIYAPSPEHYFKIYRGRDVIELPVNKVLDVNGWSLDKALRLLEKYNPTLMEWINSPKVYRKDETFYNQLVDLSNVFYNATTCKYHYYHMARGNFARYLSEEVVSMKKYLYVLRPLIAIEYINKFDRMPPTSFLQTIEKIDMDAEVKNEILNLVEAKKSGAELGKSKKSELLSEYINSKLVELKPERGGVTNHDTTELDNFLLDTIMQVNRLG